MGDIKEIHDQLHGFRFLHVTNIRTNDRSVKDGAFFIRCRFEALGSWGQHKGYTVLVTNTGEVWLRYGSDPVIDETSSDQWRKLLTLICPFGDKGELAASCAIRTGNELLNQQDMLQRLRDSSYDLGF